MSVARFPQELQVLRFGKMWATSSEIFAPQLKFHVTSPLTAPQRPPIHLIGAQWMHLSWQDAMEVKNKKLVGSPSCEAAHDVKFVPRSTDFMSRVLSQHFGDLGSN